MLSVTQCHPPLNRLMYDAALILEARVPLVQLNNLSPTSGPSVVYNHIVSCTFFLVYSDVFAHLALDIHTPVLDQLSISQIHA